MMGLDVEIFKLILEGRGRFRERWDLATIPRGDVNPLGCPCLERRSLDAVGALGLVLHYLGSAMLEVSLQQIFALTPSSTSRYFDFAQDILVETLNSIPEASISMPTDQAKLDFLSDLICRRL